MDSFYKIKRNSVYEDIINSMKINASSILNPPLKEQDNIDQKVTKSRTFKKSKLPVWESSTWGLMLKDPSIKDPTKQEGQLFRRRFRVPYPIYEDLLNICNNSDELGKKQAIDCCGFPSVPISILLLGTLRILGRGITFDGVAELSNVSEEVHRVFFHKFIEYFASKEVFSKYVYPPQNSEELDHAIKPYRIAGFPGAFASADCTHVYWDRCPSKI
jgi:hypothetical protein